MPPLTFLPIVIPEDDEVLAEEITLLSGQLNCGDYRLLKFIAAFDRREAWSGGGTVRSCAHWLNWRAGIALGAARERVRVARALEQLPRIDAALAAGQVSYSMVRAMTRVATPSNEDFLLRIAEYGTASHVEKVVSKYRRVQRSDDEAQENEQDNARKLVYFQQEDGMWVIHAKLPPEAGSLVVKAIEAVATPVQLEKQEQLKREKLEKQEKLETSREALRALAPEVDAHTCVSKWRGEDCDYGMAIDALLERDKVPPASSQKPH